MLSPLVAQMAGVRAVTEVQVLVFHEDVFVSEASVTYRALIGFLANVCQSDVPYQTVLISELLATQSALECAVVRR